MIAEGEALPFHPRPKLVGERAADGFGARLEVLEAAVGIFAADDPVTLSHAVLLKNGDCPYFHSAATASMAWNCAVSVDSLSATVDAWPPETAVATASK